MGKVDKRKIMLIGLFFCILIVLFLLVGKITFAFLADEISSDVKQSSEITATGDTLLFVKGTPITLNASSDTFTSTGNSISSTTKPSAKLVANSSSKTADATYAVGFKITGNTFSYTDSTKPELILTIKDESGNIITSSSDTLSYVTVTDRSGEEISGFDVTDLLGNFNVVVEKPINTNSSTTGTTHTLTYTLTLVNYGFDQSVNEGASISLETIVQKNPMGVNLAEFIKTQVYTGVQGENNIYYHKDLENSAEDGSYRYAGSYESVNNYVCFGYNGDDVCPWDNMYRIIGVFGDNVKLIKADYAKISETGTNGSYFDGYRYLINGTNKGSNPINDIGLYSWHDIDSIGLNKKTDTWANSDLNNINLNDNYLNKFDLKWQDKISLHDWSISEIESGLNSYPASSIYEREMVNNMLVEVIEKYSAKIGLMYVSDYMYGANPTYWTYLGNDIDISSDPDYSEAINDNWLYNGLYEWTITRSYDSMNTLYWAFCIESNGMIESSHIYNEDGALFSYIAVRPSFYLDSNVEKISGDGTKGNPYILVK